MKIFDQDINDVVQADFIPWEELKGRSVFITGGTGLIGYTLISSLILANKRKELNLKLYALVRNMDRAKDRFQNVLEQVCGSGEDVESETGFSRLAKKAGLYFLCGNVENEIDVEMNIDYIIHGASNTSSKGFVTAPVETINTSVTGTRNMLEMAKEKKVKGFLFLSSMEVYGYPEKGHKVTENEIGNLTPLDVRNCYPLSKQLCEAMCVAYSKEYHVPTIIIRLTQTFGPGVNYNDGRIFAYFLRCINEGRNIVLKTKGETERCYLYTTDAATAIITVLLKGADGEAYNAANEDTYCSISEMAEYVAKEYGIKVEYEIEDEKKNGYPKTLYMDLDTSKLKKLGWKCRMGG